MLSVSFAFTLDDNHIEWRRTDIGVIDLGEEPHLGRCHGVFFRQEQFEFEDAL